MSNRDLKEVPVYLFCGFLDGGKTKFIQETLEDRRFNAGERTLLLVCEEGTYIAVPPKVPVQSTIGAGDSAIAGFIACPEENAQQRLAWAVAYGTAACMAEGTLPPEPTDIQSVFSRIQLKKL